MKKSAQPAQKEPLKKKAPLSKGAIRPRVVISGYYGFDNLGDELILHVFVEQLKKRNLDITVLSNQPEQTRQRYGVQAIHRMKPLKVIEAISQSHLFISGGGGLFQDVTGPMSTLYYGGLLALARFLELPVCFIGQGVGPLNTSFAKLATQNALNYCSLVTVRDEGSAVLVEALTGQRPHLVKDPVWLLDVSSKQTMPAGDSDTTTPWKVGVSLRPWPSLTPERIRALASCLAKLAKDSTRPVSFLLLPFQAEHDKPVLDTLSQQLSELGLNWEYCDEKDILSALSSCHLLFGMRFHSLILGILAGVSVYGLVYDPKVQRLLDDLQLSGLDIEAMDSLGQTQTAESIQSYFNHYPEVSLEDLRQGAYRSFELLDQLLKTQNFSEFILEPPPLKDEHLLALDKALDTRSLSVLDG